MDGEPVWIYNPDTGVCLGCRVIAQYIGNQFNDKCNRFILTDRDSKFDCEYGKTWLAYRHKLEVDK
jgi:hypothetical protein